MVKRKKVAAAATTEAAGQSWTKRRAEVTLGLISGADIVVQMFYGVNASREARARPDAEFVARLAFTVTMMALKWGGAAWVLDDPTVTTADRRADFVQHVNAAWDGCDALLSLTAEAQEATSETWQASVLEAADLMEGALLRAIGLMQAPSDFDGVTAWNRAFDGSTLFSPAFFLEIHRRLVEVLADVVTLRRALLRISGKRQEPPENGPVSDAERARRYRARKRRRVAFQVLFDVYDDDIEMLRRFGLLTLSERGDREAVTDALDALLLNAFITFPHERLPWRERIARQRGRINSHKEREKSQDEQ